MLLDVWILWQKTHIKSSCIWQTAVNIGLQKKKDMIWPVLKEQVFSCFCPHFSLILPSEFFLYAFILLEEGEKSSKQKSGSLWHLAVNGWSCLTSRPSLKCKRFLKSWYLIKSSSWPCPDNTSMCKCALMMAASLNKIHWEQNKSLFYRYYDW